MIKWVEELKLGNEQIDAQHQVLIQALEDIYESCRIGEGLKDLEKRIVFLEKYVEIHFKQEEALQRRYEYPQYELHKQIHDEYRQIIRDIIEGKPKDGYTTKDLSDIVKYLNRMIVSHIYKEDRDIAQYIKGKGATLSKAFDEMGKRDALTGLLSDEMLYAKIQEVIERADGKVYSYAGIGVVGFRQVNNSYGFDIGDQVLMYISGILQMYGENIVAISRLYADHFGVLIEHSENGAEEVTLVLQKIKSRIEEGFKKQESLIPLSVCMGVASFPRDANNLQELRRAVNIANSWSGKSENHPITYYSKEMAEKILRKSKIIKLLQPYQIEKNIRVVYQPICEARTGRLKGCEALLRLVDEDGKPISPIEFIPLAEENRLINDLTYYCVHQVGTLLKEVGKEKIEYITINLTPVQVGDKDCIGEIDKILDQNRYDRKRIFFEVTESALVENCETFMGELSCLREKGAQILIDDFGQGYSSLGYLANLEVDAIKIDKSFLCGIGTNPKAEKVLKCITSLAHEIGLKVVVEGVEHEEEWEILKSMKVDRLQGYYFSKPLERDKLGEFLK